MVLNKQETRDLYRRRARRYDLAMCVYRLFGFRIGHYRRQAVAGLALQPGDTVVELGCGTGLNFGILQRMVGPRGRVIGVDLTDAMLAEARRRIDRAGWNNVELVQSDVAAYSAPEGVGGVLSTLALTLVPEFDAVIEMASGALRSGGRMAVLDMKLPEGWPDWLVRSAACLNAPYGVSLDLADRQPWESMRRWMRQVEYREFYFGALYLSVGETGT